MFYFIMGNSDSKLEEIESLRQQNALNQAQIAQLQQAMSLQEQQREQLKKEMASKKKSIPIKVPQNNPESKDYNNFSKQNQNRNSNDFRRNLGDRLYHDVENRNLKFQKLPVFLLCENIKV